MISTSALTLNWVQNSMANSQTGRMFRENRHSRQVLPFAGWSLFVLLVVLIWPGLAHAVCPPGSFYDPQNSGECWQCPSGYNRTIFPVSAANACEAVLPATFSPASRQGRHGCEPGDITDPRNGGECWQCPSGLVRTWSPVNGSNACGKPGEIFDKKQPATFIKNVGCSAGEFPDIDWCWTCPGGSDRAIATHIESNQACVVPARTEVQRATFIDRVACGRLDERACALVGRPSCDTNHVEFDNMCRLRGDCGSEGKRRCLLGEPGAWEPLTGCATTLVPVNNVCTRPACGRLDERACAIAGRPSCDPDLVEIGARCVQCGGEGQPGCPVLSPRRVPLGNQPCEAHLVEIGARCVRCGGEGQPGCPVLSPRRGELKDRPCEANLVEIGASCVQCGGEGQPGCPAFSPRYVALGDWPCEQPFEETNGRCGRPPETYCGGATRWTVGPNAGCDTYKMGLATRDITGPFVDSQMQGYANGKQISKGLHTRLWARAFVVEGCNGKRVAFVSADLAQMFHSVRQGVVEILQQSFGDKYGFDNVVISATHTHAAIQGYTDYVWLNLSGAMDASDHQGFDRDNFNAIVDGIADAIVAADQQADSTTGTIRIGAGAFDPKLSFNRSATAYNLNPAAERAGQPEVDREMTLLRFDASDGRELGSFNWLPVHNTTYSKHNPYISGDAKGIAAYWLEKEKGVVKWGNQGGYVAGFTQAHCGDVSPNVPIQAGVPNPPTSDTDSTHSRTIPNALAHLATAKSILAAASEQVNGSVEVINSFVDFEGVVVERAYSRKPARTETCKAWYGSVFQGGSKEDGEGERNIKEGDTFTGIGFFGKFLPFIGLPAAVNSVCHQKELHPIVVLGNRANVHWSPTKLPLQIVVIGQLAIAAVPFEVTTMAGRRLKKSILDALAPRVKHVVIAGLANDYAGYVTTREEHGAVHYEGASTQFGPDTEAALRQEFAALTCSLKGGSLSQPWRNVSPPDLRTGNVVGPSNPVSLVFAKGSRAQPLMSRIQPDFFDAGRKLGAIVRQVKPRYTTGETVKFQYRGGHPRRSIRKLPTFFRIERQDDRDKNVWQLVATDTSPETRFVWVPTVVKKPIRDRGPQYHSELRIEWMLSIPNSDYTAKPGTYRLRFFGHTDTGNGLKPYDGTSKEFVVMN